MVDGGRPRNQSAREHVGGQTLDGTASPSFPSVQQIFAPAPP